MIELLPDPAASRASAGDPAADAGISVLLGRQPIVNRAGSLVAYELLFRDGAANSATVMDDRAATERVIVNAIAQFGLAGTLGAHRGFVNIGRASLGSETLLLLAPGRFTLEILENVVIDDSVEAECLRLRQAGFQIALDDVVSIERIPARVLELVDVVKIDLRSVVECELAALIRKAHAAGCLVLAEKVECREEHRRFLELGADLFQGYFFARPEILRQNQVSASRASLLKLTRMLAGEPSLPELQLEVKRNPVLLAQLMKFAGSAAVSGRRDLTVAEAIAHIGTRQLARLAQLLLFAGEGRQQLEDDPLLQLVDARARFMELLAGERRPGDDAFADAAFQAGIFSLMNVLTGQSSEELLAQIGASERTQAAILRLEGELGDLLVLARLMEGTRSDPWSGALSRCGIDPARLNALFARATGQSIASA